MQWDQHRLKSRPVRQEDLRLRCRTHRVLKPQGRGSRRARDTRAGTPHPAGPLRISDLVAASPSRNTFVRTPLENKILLSARRSAQISSSLPREKQHWKEGKGGAVSVLNAHRSLSQLRPPVLRASLEAPSLAPGVLVHVDVLGRRSGTSGLCRIL